MKVLLLPRKIELSEEDITAGKFDYLYVLSEKLKKYIDEKGDSSEISRKSAMAPEINPLIAANTVSPDVYIQLDDGVTGIGNYIVNCDAYSALAGAFNNELKNIIGTPDESGLSISGNLAYSKLGDIFINFSNIETYTEVQLDSLARKLIESAYWYPIKDLDIIDDSNNVDPYFYRFVADDAWHEEASIFKLGQSYSESKGEIKEDTTDIEHPIHYLEVDSKVSGNYAQEQIGEEAGEPSTDPDNPEPTPATPIMDDPIPQHYTWSIPVSQLKELPTTLIVYAKNIKGNGKPYLKVGKNGAGYYLPHGAYPPAPQRNTNYIDKTFEKLESNDWERLELPIIGLSIEAIESIEIGVEGIGTIGYTAVWLTSNPDTYNKYPQGYRDEIEPKKQTDVPTEPMPALTLARNFEERAKDKIGVPEPTPEQETSPSPTGGESPSSPEGFGNAVAGILSQITGTLDGVCGLLDLASIMKIDTAAINGQIKEALGVATKLRLACTADKLNALKAGAKQQAEQLLKVDKDKLKSAAVALTASALSSALPKKPAKPKLPTAETDAAIGEAKKAKEAAAKNAKELIETNKNKLKEIQDKASGLKDKANELKNKVKDNLEKAEAAINSAKATVEASAKGVAALTNVVKG